MGSLNKSEFRLSRATHHHRMCSQHCTIMFALAYCAACFVAHDVCHVSTNVFCKMSRDAGGALTFGWC